MTLQKLFFCLLICCLTGCGFHLRTHALTLSPALHSPWIATAEPYSPLTHSLASALRRSGATPVDEADKASAIIAILSERETESLLSVSSTQSSRQYNLTLSVQYEIRNREGAPLTGPQVATESRTLTMASDQILSSSNEVTILYQRMRQAVVRDIMARLASPEISAILAESKKHTGRKP